jgi:hypothetical protein
MAAQGEVRSVSCIDAGYVVTPDYLSQISGFACCVNAFGSFVVGGWRDDGSIDRRCESIQANEENK